jgi:hypothetical protein
MRSGTPGLMGSSAIEIGIEIGIEIEVSKVDPDFEDNPTCIEKFLS